MKKKILIIEDDQIFANVYRNKLALDGFEVEVAHDGESGLELLDSFSPDAVLLDLMLPKLPGVEVIKQVRRDRAAELPILAFTNSFLSNLVQEAWKAGATKCLAKVDCTPNQVIATVRGLLSPPAAPGRPAEAVSEEPPGEDAEFEAELRRTFVEGLPAVLATLRGLLQALVKTEDAALRVQQARELHRRVRALASNAGLVGLARTARMADALEALLKELSDKPRNLNASTLRTVATAIDFLAILSDRTAGAPAAAPEASALVVDDEAISRRAITYALDKAGLKSTSVDDPLEALSLLAGRRFDLIFLDVDMPCMSGFELCGKLRALPPHAKTPVVFVTALNDFESRANSSMSGGTDFIAKPFLFSELAVKSLVYVLREQLGPARP